MISYLRRPWRVCLVLGLIACLTCARTLASTVSITPANFPTPRLESLKELTPEPITPRATSIKGWKTQTGTKVLFIRTTELPMFDLQVSFTAGSARDSSLPGLAATTLRMLIEGVPGKDFPAIVQTFDDLGAQLDLSIEHERVTLSLRSLSNAQKSAPALQLITQMLGESLLTDDALKKVKKALKDRIASASRDDDKLAEDLVRKLLAPNSPYSVPLYGTNEGLAAITRTDVEQFHQRFYTASHAQITLVGDLTLAQAKAISLQISNALPVMPMGGTPPPPMPVQTADGTDLTRHEERPLTQTHLKLAQRSVSRQHPDYAALYVANLIFGGTPSSRLMSELREKRGLVYNVHAENSNWATAGVMTISLQVSPSLSQATLALIRSMFSDYLRDGPTQQELDQIKIRLANSRALQSASNGQILARLEAINQHDLPLDLDYTVQQIQRLTLKQVHEAMKRHLSADRWRVATVGATVVQQPLPEPPLAPSGTSLPSMCRAEAAL
ncbi:M16 family metallopeptidase [Pseudomonas fluorescens]|uniref:M16 family metallopeptidase n=1 Tax=Pseudomonas fluorescens TaxID=294 RepID=UPI0012423A43|nr:pitrilysin family protein [Pseudomonas fluorescens]VVP28802.1 hypothetical protein PS898_04219 [Pseudomonas fluorescens]